MGTRTEGQRIRWRLYIPEELALWFEVRLYSPLNGKPEYGARSQLVTQLLERYRAELIATEEKGPTQ